MRVFSNSVRSFAAEGKGLARRYRNEVMGKTTVTSRSVWGRKFLKTSVTCWIIFVESVDSDKIGVIQLTSDAN